MKKGYSLQVKSPIKNLCKIAIKKQFIDLIALSHILAYDDQYNKKILTTLWQELGLNIRLGEKPNLSTTEKKIGAWFNLLQRMATKKVAGVLLGAASSLNSPRKDLKIENEVITLDDLKEFFVEQLELPAPTLLFPEDQNTSNKNYQTTNIKTPPIKLESELDNFLLEINSDIEVFYSEFKIFMKDHGGMLNTTLKLAQKSFNSIIHCWDFLTIEDLKGNFYGTGHYTRDIKVNIAKNIINREKLHLWAHCSDVKNVIKLESRMKLCKSK